MVGGGWKTSLGKNGRGGGWRNHPAADRRIKYVYRVTTMARHGQVRRSAHATRKRWPHASAVRRACCLYAHYTHRPAIADGSLSFVDHWTSPSPPLSVCLSVSFFLTNCSPFFHILCFLPFLTYIYVCILADMPTQYVYKYIHRGIFIIFSLLLLLYNTTKNTFLLRRVKYLKRTIFFFFCLDKYF